MTDRPAFFRATISLDGNKHTMVFAAADVLALLNGEIDGPITAVRMEGRGPKMSYTLTGVALKC